MFAHTKFLQVAGIGWYMHMINTQKIQELEQAASALAWARQQGLELEWSECYYEHRSQGYSIAEAVVHANREWDL